MHRQRGSTKLQSASLGPPPASPPPSPIPLQAFRFLLFPCTAGHPRRHCRGGPVDVVLNTYPREPRTTATNTAISVFFSRSQKPETRWFPPLPAGNTAMALPRSSRNSLAIRAVLRAPDIRQEDFSSLTAPYPGGSPYYGPSLFICNLLL